MKTTDDVRGYVERGLERAVDLSSKDDWLAAMLPLAGAVAVVGSLPFSHWTHHSIVVLMILVALAVVGSITRLIAGARTPTWARHVIFHLGLVIVSVLVTVQPGTNVHFEVLYSWVVVFAALSWTPPLAFYYEGLVGVSYGLALILGPTVENPVTAWMATFGSSAILCGVTVGLVNALRRSSREDRLTGLANRRAWDDRLDEELERARRSERPLSMVMIDVDKFKLINDRDGHLAGDELLRRVAEGWRAVVRGGGDFLARLGGDEFGLLAPDADEHGSLEIVRHLQAAIPEGITCSMGVATWDRHESGADFFRRADEAMYQVKRHRHAG